MTRLAPKYRFQIDGVINSFKGFCLDPKGWNGFACPGFEYDEVLKIAEEFGNINYDEEGDKFLVQNLDDCDNIEEFEAQMVATEHGMKKLYPIGAYGWCWSIQEQDPQFKALCCLLSTITNKAQRHEVYHHLHIRGKILDAQNNYDERNKIICNEEIEWDQLPCVNCGVITSHSECPPGTMDEEQVGEFLAAQRKCSCDMTQIMRYGCKCGGK